jgi:peroxiredoxin
MTLGSGSRGPSLIVRWLAVSGAVLLSGLALGSLYLWGFPQADTRVPAIADGDTTAPLEGAAAPDFSLKAIDGRTYRLSELRGTPVLINFWATWCEPCRLEMPAIEARYQRYGEAGFKVLAVDFDEPAGDVAAFGQDLQLTFPLLLDPGGSVQRMYRVRGYPTSFFVDSQGVVQVVQIGVMTEGQLDRNLAVLGVGH